MDMMNGKIGQDLQQMLAASGQQAAHARRAREAMVQQPMQQAQQPSLGDMGMRLAMASMGPAGGSGIALGGMDTPGADAGGTLGPFMQAVGGLGGLGGNVMPMQAGADAASPAPPIAAAPGLRMPGNGSTDRLLAALMGAYR